MPLGVALILLLGWSLWAARLPPLLLPGPMAVLRAAHGQSELLGRSAGWTAFAAVVGLGIGGGLGLSFGLLFMWSRSWARALYPYALLLQTLPVVAVAPLLVIWLGYGTPVAVASAALVSFFPMLTATHVGLSATPPEQIELLRLYGAGAWQELRYLRLPGALPHLLAGLRTGVGSAVIGAIVGEFVGSNGAPPGLGYLVLTSARAADTPLTFAAVGGAAALALMGFQAVRWLERRSIGRWHGAGENDEV